MTVEDNRAPPLPTGYELDEIGDMLVLWQNHVINWPWLNFIRAGIIMYKMIY